MAHPATRLQRPVFGLHHAADRLDVFAIDGAPAQDHLEAVVVLGIVASGDLDAAAAQGVGCEIKHRGGHHADVDHVHTGLDQAADQRGAEHRTAQTAVTTDGHAALALRHGDAAEGTTQRLGHLFVHGGRDDPADVIGLEDGGGDLQEQLSDKKRDRWMPRTVIPAKAGNQFAPAPDSRFRGNDGGKAPLKRPIEIVGLKAVRPRCPKTAGQNPRSPHNPAHGTRRRRLLPGPQSPRCAL